MADSIRLVITTVDGSICDRQVSYVEVPLADGTFGILSNHSPMLGALKAGDVEFAFEGGREKIYVPGGVVSVKDNLVTVLTRAMN